MLERALAAIFVCLAMHNIHGFENYQKISFVNFNNVGFYVFNKPTQSYTAGGATTSSIKSEKTKMQLLSVYLNRKW